MSVDGADGVPAAGSGRPAGVDTIVADACLTRRTLHVGATAYDADQLVTDFSGATVVVAATGGATDGSVALLVIQAVGGGGADGHAAAGAAHEAQGTVRVDVTGDGLPGAGHVGAGIGDEALGAGTLRPVVEDGTESVGAADGRRAARVRAPVVEARLRGGAVLVGTAPDHADVVEADVTQEAVVVQAAGHCTRKTINVTSARGTSYLPI